MEQLAIIRTTLFTEIPDMTSIIDAVTVWVNAALSVLVILEVVFATIKAIWIWWSVIRNSDEPDTRAVYLSSLKWPIISIVGTLVVIGISNVVIQIVKQTGLNIAT